MDNGSAIPARWRTYDEFVGPTLDSDRWQPLDIGSGPLLDPAARTSVDRGVLTVDIPSFTNFDTSNQLIDNCKHVILSKQGFRLPAKGVARFAVDLRAEVSGGSGDYRWGMVAFNIADMTGETNTVFNILTTGGRMYAEQEVLAVPGQEHPFTRIIEDPFFFSRAGMQPSPEFHHCEIAIDRNHGRVVWSADDAVLHQADGLTGLPVEVHVGFGFFTLAPVGEGEKSVRGQGARGSWRNFAYCLPGES